MNDQQLAYFRSRLQNSLQVCEAEYRKIKTGFRHPSERPSDVIDRGVQLSEWEVNFREQKRYYRMLQEIRSALDRIEEGTFGYCRITGEAIGIARLEVLPHTSLSLEAQETMEAICA